MIDGFYTIYRIEGKSTEPNAEWFVPNWDYWPQPKGFEWSSDCRSKTGFRATFTKAEALRGWELLSKYWPDYEWRVVEKEISCQSSIVAEITVTNTSGQKARVYGTPEEEAEFKRRYKAFEEAAGITLGSSSQTATE